MSLVRPTVGGKGELLLHNAGDNVCHLTWRQQHGNNPDGGEDTVVQLAAGETQRFILDG